MYVVQHTIEGEIEAFLLSHDHESFPGFFLGGGVTSTFYGCRDPTYVPKIEVIFTLRFSDV
jgi:hypothetical protein